METLSGNNGLLEKLTLRGQLEYFKFTCERVKTINTILFVVKKKILFVVKKKLIFELYKRFLFVFFLTVLEIAVNTSILHFYSVEIDAMY